MMDPREEPRGTTSAARVNAYDGNSFREKFDSVATEEPLEIRLVHGGRTTTAAVTMRTPGADFELAAGFLLGEGIVEAADDIASITYCVDASVDVEQRYNIVNVALRSAPRDSERLERHFVMSSACGVCGKAQLDALRTRGVVKSAQDWTVTPEFVLSLPERLQARQKIFRATGGLHAAALFARDGTLEALREDVGRHNALDKACGWAHLQGRIPLQNSVALVSGRSSFELVQKAAVAGIPILCAVSAPSSLAIDLANEFNITLIGFLRAGRFNVYTGAHRIEVDG